MSRSHKPIRILLSAYACEPNKGSEPAVGWNWAVELLKKDHDVWVLTRQNNRQAIESELENISDNSSLHFIYYDLPSYFRRWKKIPGGVYLYYLLWQIGAARKAKQVNNDIRFDLVHHVTFVSLRQPSFMGRLGIPFILGPVAGGERAPFALRKHYNWQAWCSDFLRDMANAFIRFDPLVRSSLKRATKVVVTSEQTRDLLPEKYLSKSQVSLAIGLTTKEIAQPNIRLSQEKQKLSERPLRILFMGRFLEWKGMGLGLKAFAELQKVEPNATLTMVGQGPAKKKWRHLTEKLAITTSVSWVSWLPKEDVHSTLTAHDVLLFPSLHDSGGMVVLEAMASGLPVVCLNIGGPSIAVNEGTGFCIPVINKTEQEVIDELAEALINLSDTECYFSMSKAANLRAKEFSWEQLVTEIHLDITYSSSQLLHD